jgi:hypothetical protein
MRLLLFGCRHCRTCSMAGTRLLPRLRPFAVVVVENWRWRISRNQAALALVVRRNLPEANFYTFVRT